MATAGAFDHLVQRLEAVSLEYRKQKQEQIATQKAEQAVDFQNRLDSLPQELYDMGKSAESQ
jgi:hypothetical protein